MAPHDESTQRQDELKKLLAASLPQDVEDQQDLPDLPASLQDRLASQSRPDPSRPSARTLYEWITPRILSLGGALMALLLIPLAYFQLKPKAPETPPSKTAGSSQVSGGGTVFRSESSADQVSQGHDLPRATIQLLIMDGHADSSVLVERIKRNAEFQSAQVTLLPPNTSAEDWLREKDAEEVLVVNPAEQTIQHLTAQGDILEETSFPDMDEAQEILLDIIYELTEPSPH